MMGETGFRISFRQLLVSTGAERFELKDLNAVQVSLAELRIKIPTLNE